MLLNRQLIDHNISVLKQADEVLRGLNNEEFIHVDPDKGVSSIGSHIRHVIDHYMSFIQGMKIGIVNYDERERDATYETHLLIARRKIHEICQSLEKFKTSRSGMALKNQTELTISCGMLAPRAKTMSSVQRELGFLHGHAVHHFAFVRLLINAKEKIPNDTFGVAPATLAYHANNG